MRLNGSELAGPTFIAYTLRVNWVTDGVLGDALGGASSAIQIVGLQVKNSGPIGARYMAGDCVGAWLESVAGRAGSTEATALAWETMRRVRHNLHHIVDRLRASGYQFANANPLGAPVTEPGLSLVEQQIGGHLPLSLKMFWHVIGSVDLTQSADQVIGAWGLDGPELNCLGLDDPLVVPHPDSLDLDDLMEYGGDEDSWPEYPESRSKFLVHFSQDRFAKANHPGEHYSLWLPDSAADVRLFQDLCPADERPLGRPFDRRGQFFVRLLRDVCRHGGFRGPVDIDALDLHRLPMRNLQRQLAEGLLPL